LGNVRRVEYIDRGATGTAWRIDSAECAAVLRLADPRPGKVAAFEAEAAFRQRLADCSSLISRPIATNADYRKLAGAGVRWSLDCTLPGATGSNDPISISVWHDVGALLGVVHGEPATGYGRPVDSRLEIIGQARSPIDGVLSRFRDAWPLAERDLAEHPVMVRAPYLVDRLRNIETDLVAVSAEHMAGPIHGDLHIKQILVSQNKLTGLIDFGELSVLDPAWDFASIVYFNGSVAFEAALDGYGRSASTTGPIRERSAWLAIIIALYHLDRASLLGSPSRAERACSFLAVSLADTR